MLVGWMWKRSTVLAVTVCAACSAVPLAVPPVPSHGGPAWLELTSEHFVVWTDASPESGRALIHSMERLREVVYDVSYFNDIVRSRIFVVALRNATEVHAYVPRQFIAEAWTPDNPLRQPIIVLPVDQLDEDRAIVTHELIHAISHDALPVQPQWFAEGLATYFETLELHEEDSSVDVGAPAAGRLRLLQVHHPLPVGALLGCHTQVCVDDTFYATAWAVFALLKNEQPDELMHYMQRLAASPAAASDAWSEAFPTLPAEALDEALPSWLAHGKVSVGRYQVKLRDWPIEQRPLGDGDAYAARGMLRYLSSHGESVPDEIFAALAADPTNVVALVIKAGLEKVVDADVARRVAAAHPDDWRAWWLVAASQDAESERAVTKLCALVAKNRAALPEGLCRDAGAPGTAR